MLSPEQTPPDIFPYLAHGLLALFGALVHAASAHREGRSKTLVDFSILVLLASFSGVIFALLGFHLFAGQQYLTMATAGTGGFVGIEGMTWVVTFVRAKLK